MSMIHAAFLGGFAVPSPVDGVMPDEGALAAVSGTLSGFHAQLGLGSGDDTAGISSTQQSRIDSLGRDIRVRLTARHADSLLAQGMPTAAARSRVDSAWTERARRDSARLDRVHRADATIPATSGYHLARELEDISAEVLRTAEAPRNGWTLFPRFGINPGAKRWGFRRITRTGDASFYVGGNEPIPSVNNARNEVLFPQHTLVTSFGWDMFEAMASDFASSNYVSEGLAACQLALSELGNHLIFNGSPAHGCFGLLNYPKMPRIYSSTAFDGTASVDDVLAALNRAYNYSTQASKGTLRHNTVVMGRRVYNYLSDTRIGTVTDTTILQFWMSSKGITSVEIADELDGAGRNGRSLVLFYNRDPRTGVSVALGADFTALPPQLMGFGSRVYCYMRFGGLRIPDIGGQTLLEVETAPV